jgi:hypothetical protein
VSFITATNTEVLYCMPAPGAALATSVTKTVITANTTTNPAYQQPALNAIWPPDKLIGRALRYIARGGVGTTATPTLQLQLYLDPTQNSTTSQILLGGTGALTTGSGLGGGASMTGNWELELDLVITAVGVTSGAYNCTVYTSGIFSISGTGTAGNDAATAVSVQYMIGSNTAKTTIVPGTAYWPEIWATWGTSNAANSIQCSQFLVFGLT